MEYIIIALVMGVIWGFVGRAIVGSKGYDGSDNHGFAWGFWLGIIGLIVCASKPANISYNYNNKPLFQDQNDSTMADTTNVVRELENLKKLKDIEMISDEEFKIKERELKNLYFNNSKTTIHTYVAKKVPVKSDSWNCPECDTSNPLSYLTCKSCGYTRK
jgi:uncharacterized membrane protein YeaQ/YmgE (transglycosylase-associated protein family)/predicted Zn-ribbon and HTH transcriptional regulator